MTSVTPLSGTLATTYTYDAANHLADREVSDGRAHTYTWSARGQMLAEYTQGIPVRTLTYDGAGRMVEATVPSRRSPRPHCTSTGANASVKTQMMSGSIT
jgi:YD repeat-containing protein